MRNADRYYPKLVLELSASDASLNRATINAALLAHKGSPTAVVIPSGEWPYDGTITNDSAILVGDDGAILVGVDGSSAPRCAPIVIGNYPVVDGVKFRYVGATVRTAPLEYHGLTAYLANGAKISRASAIGSAGMGITTFGSNYSLIEGCFVSDNLSDGFHVSYGSKHCEVSCCVAERTGDDFFAVVSYLNEIICENILFIDFNGSDQRAPGRGFTVDGGRNITARRGVLTDVTTRGIYISTEDINVTSLVENVVLDSILIDGCGLNGIDADPGAAGVWVGKQSDRALSGVKTSNVVVKRNTGPAAFNFLGAHGQASSVDFSGVTQA